MSVSLELVLTVSDFFVLGLQTCFLYPQNRQLLGTKTKAVSG